MSITLKELAGIVLIFCAIGLSAAQDDQTDIEQAVLDALPRDTDLAPGYQWDTTFFKVDEKIAQKIGMQNQFLGLSLLSGLV